MSAITVPVYFLESVCRPECRQGKPKLPSNVARLRRWSLEMRKAETARMLKGR